jgi:citrate lyase subunit beta/citryl-CoA lyase
MEPFVRRSHLLVSLLNRKDVETSWTHNADAVILDMADLVPSEARPYARELVRESISFARKGGAEVFVRINRTLAYADIEASAWHGLKGIVFSGVESGAEIAEADSILAEMEKRRGIKRGTLHIIVQLGSGKGIWNVREIIKASPRICSVGLNESEMCRSLRIMPSRDFDPFVYAKGRIIVEGRAAKIQPIGVAHPLGILPRSDDSEELYRLILKGKNFGFAGAICPDPAWVEPCNRAFTPPAERIEFYRETRRLFAEGVARGTAAVPYPGTKMMIDVPVDERARITLELMERCAARDAEKAAALQKAQD